MLSFSIDMKFRGDKEKIDVTLVAQFATHQEILPKLNSMYKSSNQVQIRKTDGGMANPTFKHFYVWPSS